MVPKGVGGLMAGSTLLMVAAQIRRKCIRKLKEAKAISPETAVTEGRLKLDWLEKRHFKMLIKEKKVCKTEDDRYYVECKDDKHC